MNENIEVTPSSGVNQAIIANADIAILPALPLPEIPKPKINRLQQQYDRLIEISLKRINAGEINTPIRYRKPIYFNPHYWSDHPELDRYADELKIWVRRISKKSRYSDAKLKNNIKVLCLNLIRASLLKTTLSISMNKNDYANPKRYTGTGVTYRYNPACISYTLLRDIIETLKRESRIKVTQGFYAHSKKEQYKNRRTKIKVTGFNPLNMVRNGVDIGRYPQTELIELKKNKELDPNKKKRFLDYKETDRTAAMRKQLRLYNALITDSDIELDVQSEYKCFIDYSDTTVKRVFNNGSFHQGGRFYSGWWQNIKSGSRQHLTINDNPTVELDFKALHPTMLYQQEGIILNPAVDDPYKLLAYDNHPQPKKLRKLIKDTVLTMFNASTDTEALRATLNAIREDRTQEPEDREYPDKEHEPIIKELMQHLRDKHQPIADYFCSGIGLKSQYKDSLIAEHIISTMTKQGKLVLCYHDGFRVEAHNEELLRQLMIEGYQRVMKTDAIPVIEND